MKIFAQVITLPSWHPFYVCIGRQVFIKSNKIFQSLQLRFLCVEMCIFDWESHSKKMTLWSLQLHIVMFPITRSFRVLNSKRTLVINIRQLRCACICIFFPIRSFYEIFNCHMKWISNAEKNSTFEFLSGRTYLDTSEIRKNAWDGDVYKERKIPCNRLHSWIHIAFLLAISFIHIVSVPYKHLESVSKKTRPLLF